MTMPTETAKVFMSGNSQAVRLPLGYRFDVDVVYIRRDASGDVILSTKPGADWASFMRLRDELGAAGLGLPARDRAESESRDPFEGWHE